MRPQAPTHPEDDRLLELAYGEVPAAEARALRTHVDACARCRTVLDGIAEVRTAFRSVPPEAAPDRGLESLLAYGEQAAARARSRRGGLRILGVLSAVAALAVVWLVIPPSRRQAEVAVQAPAAPRSEALARADTQGAPAQGDRAADEVREKGKAEALPGGATPELPAPVRRASPAASEARTGGLLKRDAPAEQKALAQAQGVTRPEMTPATGAGARANTSGGAFAGAGATSMKKSAAGADKGQGSLEESRAREAAKTAAAPVADALAAADTVGAKPLAKAAPPPAAMRVGLGSAEQQARLADIQRKLVNARGDERKTLLMAQCELEASLGRGPDAVLSCSNVAREFPGTPEARRASEIARGFSLQPPVQPADR